MSFKKLLWGVNVSATRRLSNSADFRPDFMKSILRNGKIFERSPEARQIADFSEIFFVCPVRFVPNVPEYSSEKYSQDFIWMSRVSDLTSSTFA